MTFPGQDGLGTSEREVPPCQLTARAVPSLPAVTRLTWLCLKPPAAVNPWQTSQAAMPGREPGAARLPSPSPERPGQEGIQRWLRTTTENPALSLPSAISRPEIPITELEFSNQFSQEQDSAAPATLQFPPNSFSLGDRVDSTASSGNELEWG